ncbi:MAG TPA: hypothetical protein H9909_16495 [Candidatus Mediterraneibacter norfolkensis]|nr:hypothetical protein [Candidatus Mediterraneibacter norfolkensis]
MRITTNMIMRNYQNNLYSTMGGLDSSRKQVETGQRIFSAYEDPASAARAAVLDRRYARNQDYINNIESSESWLDEQESVIYRISNIADQISKDYSVAAMNSPIGSTGRDTYAEQLRNLQNTMVQFLNTKYGDSFLLGGNVGTETAPFELTDNGELLYRGLDVSDPANAAALQELANETSYVDIGFGLSFDANNQIISSTAVNTALPGINAVGYGVAADGVTSNNLIVLVGDMADILAADDFDEAEYSRLWDLFQEGTNQLKDTITELGTKSNMLETTKNRLEDEAVSLQEQYSSEIGIEPAEAITNYSWAMYAYTSALKIGTGIIGPSLLDFLS